jgi:hypothetical protein
MSSDLNLVEYIEVSILILKNSFKYLSNRLSFFLFAASLIRPLIETICLLQKYPASAFPLSMQSCRTKILGKASTPQVTKTLTTSYARFANNLEIEGVKWP